MTTTTGEPVGVTEVVTPSGIGIYYQAGPKRLYRIWDAVNDDWAREEVPSPSKVVGVLENGALGWWGMQKGVEGLMELLHRRVLSMSLTSHELFAADRLLPVTVDDVVNLLKEHHLTVNHLRDRAGTRGTEVHDAMQVWCETGTLPAPSVYSPDTRGYVEALIAFIRDADPEPIFSEIMVGSLLHGFAGRLDLIANIRDPRNTVYKTYPKRAPLRGNLPAGQWLLDLKTSKGIYPSHKLQLAGYELAVLESGYVTGIENRGIVRLCPDGRYELAHSEASTEDFVTTLDTYRIVEELK